MMFNICMWLLTHLFLAGFMFAIYLGLGEQGPEFIQELIAGLPVIAIIEFIVIGFMWAFFKLTDV